MLTWETPFDSGPWVPSTLLLLFELAMTGQSIGQSKYLCIYICSVLFSLYRKCKLATTGPWQEVPPIPLSDVTILPCSPKTTEEQVPLWAISNKGDVLCRLGVTSLTPAVRYHLLKLQNNKMYFFCWEMQHTVYSFSVAA